MEKLLQKLRDSGISAEEFRDYCQVNKTGWDKIENWTLDEIETYIQQILYSRHIREEESVVVFNEDYIFQLKEGPALIAGREFGPLTECVQTGSTELVPGLVVEVEAAELFNNYVNYSLRINSGKTVSRREDDLLWLRATLAKTHPFLYIPPIFSKASAEQDLEVRRQYMQLFFNLISRNPEYFADGLDSASLEEFKKQYKDAKAPSMVKNVYTREGVRQVRINNQFQNYFSAAKKMIDRESACWAKVKQLTEEVEALIGKASDKMKSMVEVIGQLEISQLNFRNGITSGRIKDLQSSYQQTKACLSSWSQGIGLTVNVLSQSLGNYFRYRETEVAAMEELIGRRRTFAERMVSAKHDTEEYYRTWFGFMNVKAQEELAGAMRDSAQILKLYTSKLAVIGAEAAHTIMELLSRHKLAL